MTAAPKGETSISRCMNAWIPSSKPQLGQQKQNLRIKEKRQPKKTKVSNLRFRKSKMMAMCQPIVRFGYVCQPVFLQAAKAPARLTVSAYAKEKLLCRLSLPALLVIMVKPLRMVNSPSANRACGVSWTITAMFVLNVDFRVVKIKSGFPGAVLSTRPQSSREAKKSDPTLSNAAPRRRDEKAGLISGFSFVNKVMGYEYKGYLSKKKHLFTMEIPIFSGG